MSLTLHAILVDAVGRQASDIHLKVGLPPIYRIHGDLTPAGQTPLPLETINQFVADTLPPHLKREFALEKECDFAILDPEAGRFRVSLFVTQGLEAVDAPGASRRRPLAGAARAALSGAEPQLSPRVAQRNSDDAFPVCWLPEVGVGQQSKPDEQLPGVGVVACRGWEGALAPVPASELPH